MIDRIAYSPYGEATRTLRSDVNGDGFVNQSDHTGIIRPRNGATIGTAAVHELRSFDARRKPLGAMPASASPSPEARRAWTSS